MERDYAYLLDMLLAARDAVEFSGQITYSQFENSRLHQNAILKAVEIVGEAASQVSSYERTPARHSMGPRSWACVIGWCMPISTLISVWFGRLFKKTCLR